MDLGGGAGGVEDLFPGSAIYLMKLIFLLKRFHAEVLGYLGSVCYFWNASTKGEFEEGATIILPVQGLF